MTPAQDKALAVALDGLRENEVPPADVVRALYGEAAARMLRAERLSDPGARDVFDEDCFEHWVSHGHGSIGSAALAVLGLPCAHERATPIDGARSRCSKCGEHEPLSPAETPAGQSAHRLDPPTRLVSDPFGNLPAMPHQGLRVDPSGWRCTTCGLHACACDSFPGAGAG